MEGIDQPYLQYMYSYPHKTAYGKLENVNLMDYVKYLEGRENSLYIHLPFCQYKCGYCNLFSITGASRNMMEAYVDKIEMQAEKLSEAICRDGTSKLTYTKDKAQKGRQPEPEDKAQKGRQPEPENAAKELKTSFCDLTLGGGTPLILDIALLQRLFKTAEKYFEFKNKPVIVETSPNQTSTEKLYLLKEEGAARISIGVQSFQENELEVLRRFHNKNTAHAALKKIFNVGFECVNIDIIYGIPGQTKESLLDTLEQAVFYGPDELFIYPLYVKPGTALYKEGRRISEGAGKLYLAAKEFLIKHGYERKSMRRFVKAPAYANGLGGKSAGKDINYGLCGFSNTISLGCGARTYIGNLHFCTPYAVGQGQCQKEILKYLNQEDFLNIKHGFILNEDEVKRRYVIKHILYGRGISRKDYREHFKREPQEDFPVLIEWEGQHYTRFLEDFISLTDEGMDLSDYLGTYFISENVKEKMKGFYGTMVL